MINDTIAAISTPRGKGGVALIRISGDDALKVLGKCFSVVALELVFQSCTEFFEQVNTSPIFNFYNYNIILLFSAKCKVE